MGKTTCALTASATSRARDARRLVYATRTNSQQAQVLREHQVLRRAGEDVGRLIPFMGRRQYCPLLRHDDRFKEGTAEELGKLCSDAKQKARQEHATGKPVKGACSYYLQLLEDGPGPVEALLEDAEDASALGEAVAAAGSCPYEALKLLLPTAEGVVLPHIFLVDSRLRRTLGDWLGVGLDECHVIIDEAHHLPDAARAHHSPRLTGITLKRAIKEAGDVGDPTLLGRLLTTDLLHALETVLQDLVDEFVHDEDGLLPPGALEEALLPRLRLSTPVLRQLANELEQWGVVVREEKRAKGRLPRSYLGAVGQFLLFWTEDQEAPYVHLVTGGDHPALEAYLLDPAAVLGWMTECGSTTQMSGTLAPLEDHRDVCGLPSAKLVQLPSPFDPDRLRVVGIQGIHRRYEAVQKDPSIVEKQQSTARQLLQAWSGRIGLFFPSHAMLANYLEEGFLHGLDARLHIEQPGMSQAELQKLVDRFRQDRGARALLLGVLGGRLTEGIDYPGDAMERMIVFGIPYPRPTARIQALVHHFDRRTGGGWQTAVHNPTGRVLRQAVGRLIRGPEDTGLAVILDERIVRFQSMFHFVSMVDDWSAVEAAPTGGKGGFVAASDI